MEEDFVKVNGEKIYFYIQRKKVKNMNLRVTKDKEIIISIPNRISLNKAKDFVKEKINWIKKQQSFYDTLIEKRENIEFKNGKKLYLIGKQYNINIIKDLKNNILLNNEIIELHIKDKYSENTEYIRKIYEKFLKEYGQDIFAQYVSRYCNILKKYNIRFPEIKIRKMKAKWGYCMPKCKRIVFNLHLIKAPIECIEYVVLHELSHFKYPNHSKNFYNFIEQFMPNWKKYRNILNKEFSYII